MTELFAFVLVAIVVAAVFAPTDKSYRAHCPCNDPACYMTTDCAGFDDD